jgi:hypothetical protein
MLDTCVLTFGTIVENALLERDEMGSGAGKKYVSRYSLAQLLDPDFKLPDPTLESVEELKAPVAGLLYDEV